SNREGSPHHAFIKSGRLSRLGLPIDSRQPFNDELDGTIDVGIAVGDRTRKQLAILWPVQTVPRPSRRGDAAVIEELSNLREIGRALRLAGDLEAVRVRLQRVRELGLDARREAAP